jgi:protoheme IX farnesyltransferase
VEVKRDVKATAESLSTSAWTEKSSLAVWSDLFKARLTGLVLVTNAVGFYLADPGPLRLGLLLSALGGTALLAAGAAALNQWLERDYDARMQRTQDRPLPSGRLQPETALGVGCGLVAGGLVSLAWLVNAPTALVGALTLLSYLLVYTPLKRVTTWNTLVGAVPGALPPVMGWTAARGGWELEAATLFAILALWQLPHFLAIAWIYREDYARGGFAMLPVFDVTGAKTSRQALGHALVLLPVSLAPYGFGLVGGFYLAGALVLGALFAWQAWRFYGEVTPGRARRLFLCSIVYLPLLLGLMVLDKVG